MEAENIRLWTDRIKTTSLTVACNLPDLTLAEFQKEVIEFLQYQDISAKLTFIDVTPPHSRNFIVRVEWDEMQASEQDVLFACDAKGAYSVAQAATRSHYDR